MQGASNYVRAVEELMMWCARFFFFLPSPFRSVNAVHADVSMRTRRTEAGPGVEAQTFPFPPFPPSFFSFFFPPSRGKHPFPFLLPFLFLTTEPSLRISHLHFWGFISQAVLGGMRQRKWGSMIFPLPLFSPPSFFPFSSYAASKGGL